MENKSLTTFPSRCTVPWTRPLWTHCIVCLMRPTARTSWPSKDILVTRMLRRGILILLIKSRSIKLVSPWGRSEVHEMAKGILRHTKVKSVLLSIETLSVVIGIFLIKKDNRYLIQRRFCQSWIVRQSVNSSTQRGVPGARSRLPRLPGAKLSISYNSVLSLKNRYERVSSSSNLKQRIDTRGYLAAAARKNFCTEIVPDSLSKPSLSIRRPHPTLLHPI